MSTTPAPVAKKSVAKKPAAKKTAAPAKKAKASKGIVHAITAIVEEFRKNTEKTVTLIVAEVQNRTECWTFNYKNEAFVCFSPKASVEAAVTKVVQKYNADQGIEA